MQRRLFDCDPPTIKFILNYQLASYETNKASISCFDAKRDISSDIITSYAYGHYKSKRLRSFDKKFLVILFSHDRHFMDYYHAANKILQTLTFFMPYIVCFLVFSQETQA